MDLRDRMDGYKVCLHVFTYKSYECSRQMGYPHKWRGICRAELTAFMQSEYFIFCNA